MRRVGYVHSFSDIDYIEEQSIALQELTLDALFYQEDYNQTENVLDEIITNLNNGDQLIIYELVCLGKAVIQLGEFLQRAHEQGINIVILKKEGIFKQLTDEAICSMVIGISFTEKKIIADRTTKGLAVARRQGRIGGRPKISEETIREIYHLYHEYSLTLREIAEQCNVSLGTAHKYTKID